MSDVQQTIDRYIEIWNETDPERRRQLIELTWTEDGSYVDPVMTGAGHDGFDALMDGVQTQYAGHHVRRTTGIDAHHDRARFGWAVVSDATGTTVAAGIDLAHLAPDGRLASITGFFDQVPAAPEGAN